MIFCLTLPTIFVSPCSTGPLVQGKDFPIHGDNFRYASWNEHHRDSQGRKVNAKGEILIHPEPVDAAAIDKIKVHSSLRRHFSLSVFCQL